MSQNSGLLESAAWWLLAVVVLLLLGVFLVLRARRKRARRAAIAPATIPIEAAFLDSSHIGGPIVGTEQFERFNPDTSKRKGRLGP